MTKHTVSRRAFLMGSAALSGAGLVRAANIKTRLWPGNRNDVQCGIIGYGPQGRDITATLARVPGAQVAAICDTYAPMLRRAQRDAPEATRHEDYREILDNPDIQAVIVATPTHLHRDIAVSALQAGKNVYCEAPIASSIEDAKAIARACA